MQFKNTNRILATILCVFMLALTPVGFSGVQRAEAIVITSDTSWAGITTALKSVLSEASNLASAVANKALALKEFTLDGIARSLAQNALNQLTADMVNWINGGMNGSPAFVTNLEEYLLSVADQTAGEFIYGEELSNLCEPIQVKVRSAVLKQYVEHQRGGASSQQCTFDQVEGANYQAFVDGDFSQGGWLAFLELTVKGNNDPVKAYYNAKVTLDERIAEAEQNKREQLAWGRGFLSKEVCSAIQSATGYSRQRCETVTPGALMQDALSYFVGELPAQRLLQIDEINEVFTALASSLTNNALKGTYGLLGLGNSKYSQNQFGSGSQSYLQALASEQTLLTGNLTKVLDDAIKAEQGYVKLQELIIDVLEDVKEDVEEAEEDNPQCFNLEFPEEFEDELDNAKENIEVSEEVQVALNEMRTRLVNATTTAAQDVVYRQYQALEDKGLIRTEYENQRLEAEFIQYDLRNRVDAFDEKLAAEIRRCGGGSGSGSSTETR